MDIVAVSLLDRLEISLTHSRFKAATNAVMLSFQIIVLCWRGKRLKPVCSFFLYPSLKSCSFWQHNWMMDTSIKYANQAASIKVTGRWASLSRNRIICATSYPDLFSNSKTMERCLSWHVQPKPFSISTMKFDVT